MRQLQNSQELLSLPQVILEDEVEEEIGATLEDEVEIEVEETEMEMEGEVMENDHTNPITPVAAAIPLHLKMSNLNLIQKTN